MNIALRFVIAVALLAGCSVAPLTPTTEVGPERGVVVLRLATNIAPAGFFATYDKMHLVSDTGIFELSRSTVGVVRTGVFTGALAPGRYRPASRRSAELGVQAPPRLGDQLPRPATERA